MEKFNAQDIMAYVEHERTQGKTNQEMYSELITRYSDKRAVAITITSVALPEDIEKYKWLSYLLRFIQVLLILSLLATAATTTVSWTSFSFILGTIFFFLLVITTSGIFKYQGMMFTLNSSVLVGFALGNVSTNFDPIAATKWALAIAGAGLSYYLAKKIFPNMKRDIKLDANGDFILP